MDHHFSKTGTSVRCISIQELTENETTAQKLVREHPIRLWVGDSNDLKPDAKKRWGVMLALCPVLPLQNPFDYLRSRKNYKPHRGVIYNLFLDHFLTKLPEYDRRLRGVIDYLEPIPTLVIFDDSTEFPAVHHAVIAEYIEFARAFPKKRVSTFRKLKGWVPYEDRDGKLFINACSHSTSDLGKSLSHFSHTPFETDFGEFNTMEGYWQWVKTGMKHDEFRTCTGREAKLTKHGTVLMDRKKFHTLIQQGVQSRFQNNEGVFHNTLEALNYPLGMVHYYQYGEGYESIIVVPEQHLHECDMVPWYMGYVLNEVDNFGEGADNMLLGGEQLVNLSDMFKYLETTYCDSGGSTRCSSGEANDGLLTYLDALSSCYARPGAHHTHYVSSRFKSLSQGLDTFVNIDGTFNDNVPDGLLTVFVDSKDPEQVKRVACYAEHLSNAGEYLSVVYHA